MHKAKNNVYIAIGIIVATLILFIGIMYTQINGDKIAKNTYIGDINIGNLTKDEAKSILKDKLNIGIIKLSFNDKQWSVAPSEVDASYNFDETIERAYNFNRDNNILDSLSKTIKTNFGSKNAIDMVVNYNEDKLKSKLEKIKDEIDIEMKNSTLNISGNNITVTDDSKGLELDIENSLNKIKVNLQNGILSDELVVNEVEPTITKSDLVNVNTILGRYTTAIKGSSAGRISNIKIAAEKMNNFLMMPGDEFSYVDETGPYTASNGYNNAPVIVEGELQNGMGGGVCQLSSTLYNSVLYAGLEIVELRNHTIPSSYVPKGRDATVTDSGVDFVFKNNLTEPVYLKSYVYGSTLVTEIYGSNKDKQNIEIQTNIDSVSEANVKTIEDPTIEKGKEEVIEKGRDGYTVSTYRIYKDNEGNVIKKEKIYTSYYPKKQKVVAVGTKEIEQETNKEDVNKEETNKDENVNNPQEGTQESTTSDQENTSLEQNNNEQVNTENVTQ
ncbi:MULTISPECIES: VanW family protein [unclassified Romboutsia]|uniref:VanW family protein n=1 Tax=unclassified Romboutsia TaxID=2626894 RepID=UPI000F046DC9|nr:MULTISPECIES: VanW family protein [unclassified Romboutsia]